MPPELSKTVLAEASIMSDVIGMEKSRKEYQKNDFDPARYAMVSVAWYCAVCHME